MLNIILSFVSGLIFYFLIIRPIEKLNIRKEFKSKGLPMNKLKWYEWFI